MVLYCLHNYSFRQSLRKNSYSLLISILSGCSSGQKFRPLESEDISEWDGGTVLSNGVALGAAILILYCIAGAVPVKWFLL